MHLSRRLLQGYTTPRMLIYSTCTPASLFTLMVLICPSCGLPNIISKIVRMCMNMHCQADLFQGLVSCVKHCGEWFCEKGEAHYTYPGDLIEKCGQRSITIKIHEDAVKQVDAVAMTIWLQIRGSVTLRNGRDDFAGRPNPTTLQFIEIFWEVATEAAADILDCHSEAMKSVFTEMVSNAETNDLAACKSSFALMPGAMSTFEIEDLEKDADVLLTYVPDKLIAAIAKKRLSVGAGIINHAAKWLGLNITRRLSLQFALEDINQEVGSPIHDEKVDFQLRITRMKSKLRPQFQPKTMKDELKLLSAEDGFFKEDRVGHVQLEDTPMKDDRHLPSPSDGKFRIFSTPINDDCSKLVRRRQLSDQTTARIVMNYPQKHPITSHRQLHSEHSSLLFRPERKEIIPDSEMLLLESDDEIYHDWLSNFRIDYEDICNQTTRSITPDYSSGGSLETMDCNISTISPENRGRKRKWSEALGQASL